jgi:hypothetical protein
VPFFQKRHFTVLACCHTYLKGHFTFLHLRIDKGVQHFAGKVPFSKKALHRLGLLSKGFFTFFARTHFFASRHYFTVALNKE